MAVISVRSAQDMPSTPAAGFLQGKLLMGIVERQHNRQSSLSHHVFPNL